MTPSPGELIAPEGSDPGLLSSRAYAQIKRDIQLCLFAPGEEVTESQLCAAYGLGKASVRAALAQLRHENLVTPLARRGYRVAPITIRDVKEIFQLRRLLEPAAARLAAGKVERAELLAIESAYADGYVPGDRSSEAAFLEANRRFHVTVARRSGNGRLAAMIDRLIDENDRVLHLGLALADRSTPIKHEHGELIDALVAGDGDRAADLAEAAMIRAEQMVMDALLTSPNLLEQELGTEQSLEPNA